MKIAVVGAGVSGSYLTALLRNSGVNVEVYEREPERRGHYCAWGSHYTLLREKLSKVGLNVDDYVLTRVKRVYVNGVEVGMGNTVIIDKPRMLRDMLSDGELFASNVDISELASKRVDLNLIVNATGTPHPKTPHTQIFTVESKSILDGAEENTAYVLFDLERVGYGWVFPLDDDGKWFHVGAGCLKSDWDATMLMLNTLSNYDLTVARHTCTCERTISIIKGAPAIAEGRTIYVGESAGAVNPITGEGILTSMDTAEALAESIRTFGGDAARVIADYSRRIMPMISEHVKAYRLLEEVKKHRRLGMLRIMIYMIKRSKSRSKPKLSPKSILRLLAVLGVLRRNHFHHLAAMAAHFSILS